MSSILGQSSIGISMSQINSLISQTINSQRQPINTLKTQKDQLTIKAAMYSDIKSMLSTLNTIINDLESSGSNYVFNKMTATSSNSSIITASAESSAAKSTYTITVSELATAHRIRSDQQSGTLSLTGTFTLNDKTITVTNATLEDIRDAINNTQFAEGKKLSASIVSNTLFINATSTGASNQITFSDPDDILYNIGILKDTDSDGHGDEFKNELQTAKDSLFTVNGIAMNSEKNNDVTISGVNGVTINLLGKTEEEITLTVQPDYTAIRAKINAFINNFNEVINYLKAKTTTTVDQKNNVYTRGALVGDTIFNALRTDLILATRTSANKLLFSIASGVNELKEELDSGTVSENLRNAFASSGITLSSGSDVTVSVVASGSEWKVSDRGTKRIFTIKEEDSKLNIYEAKSLSDIGITLNSDMTLSSNAETLNSALDLQLADVKNIFESVSAKYESILDPFTTSNQSKNALELYIKSINSKKENIDSRISRLEESLSKKEELLKKQYYLLYQQNIQFSTQQYFSLYSLFNTIK